MAGQLEMFLEADLFPGELSMLALIIDQVRRSAAGLFRLERAS